MANGTSGEELPAGGSAFTNKEMWVRVDAKLDTLVARQQHFDVELALLKERQHQHEAALAAHDAAEQLARREVAAALSEADKLMAREVAAIKEGQVTVKSAVKWATAVIIGVSVILDAGVRFFAR